MWEHVMQLGNVCKQEVSANIKCNFDEKESTNVKGDQLDKQLGYMPRLTMLNNTSSQVTHKATENIQRTQFDQILIGSDFSTSTVEGRMIPSNTPQKIQNRVTLVEAYEH